MAKMLLTLRKRRFWRRRYAIVWFDPMPTQAAYMQSMSREKFLSGGVRSGKTITCACDIAMQSWGVKGLFFEGWPADGRRRDYWAVALSTDKLRDPIKIKLREFLGPRAKWKEAQNRFVVPNGTVITCKSQEAEPDKFQSSALDGAWVDEIGKDQERYQHIKDRLTDRKGRVSTSFAPTRGRSWYADIHDTWEEGSGGIGPHKGVEFFFLNTERNVYQTAASLHQLTEGFISEDERRVKLYGEMLELRGLVFPTFNQSRNVIECVENGVCSIPPKEEWLKWRGHDFGYSDLSASTCVWMAVDPVRKALMVYREVYEHNLSVPQIAVLVKAKNAGDIIEADVADPALWKSEPHKDALGRWAKVADDYRAAGLDIVPGNNNWAVGVQAVAQMLGNAEIEPRLFVHRCCPNTIREFRRYHFPDSGAEKLEAKAGKGDDHAIDPVRYLTLAVRPYLESGARSGGFRAATTSDGGFDNQQEAESRFLRPDDLERRDIGEGKVIYVARWQTEQTQEDDGFE